MTAFERWGKGIGFGIFAVLVVLLVDKPDSEPLSFHLYFMVGSSSLIGWLAGSAEERRLRKPPIAG